MVAEYEEGSASDPLEPRKLYARANGKLVAIHSACGPAPLLELVTPPPNPPNLKLMKTDFLDPEGDYTVVIQSESGDINTLYFPKETGSQFEIQAEYLFSGNNWVRIKAHADCGQTGYSNAVSYIGGGGDCLETAELAHTGFSINGETIIHLQAEEDGCSETSQYNAYYHRVGIVNPVLLASGLAEPYWVMPNTLQGAGHGDYWFAEFDPVTRQEVGFSPKVINNALNSGDPSGNVPGAGSWRTEYIHSDHLGSTRLITDEMGLAVSDYKYYPFGHYADTSSGSDVRMKFTGHERDEELGLDYMLARYHGSSLGRFLSVDPVAGRAESPQRWNRYAYVKNNPLRLVDPDGQEEVTFGDRKARVLYTVTLGGNEVVQETLNKHRQPGSPDLHIGTSEFRNAPAGQTDTTQTVTYDALAVATKGDAAMLPATGENIVSVEHHSTEITLHKGVYANSQVAKAVGIEEAGHADSAITDAKGFLKRTANDQARKEDGTPKDHADRPEEQHVQTYINKATRGQ